MRRSGATLAAAVAAALAAASPAAPLPVEIRTRPLRFEAPQPQRQAFSNGITVHLLEDHALPVLSLTAYVRAGSVEDPAELAGLAEVTAEALRSGGSADLDAAAFEGELADLAAQIEVEVDRDQVEFTLWTPAERSARAMELFAVLLRRPVFSAAAVRTARERRTEEARREEDLPEQVVEREFTRLLMAGHSYGNWPDVGSVGRIDRAAVRRFYARTYRPSRVILAAAGDFRSVEMVDRLRGLLGDWAEPAEPADPAGKDGGPEAGGAAAAAGLVFIPRDLAQTSIMIGHRGPRWDDPDLPALEILSQLISYNRFYLDVRDNRGLAYTAYAVFTPRRLGGVLEGYAGTRAEAAPESLELMRRHLDEVAAGRFTDAEAASAREAVAASFLHRFSTAAAAARQFALAELRGLPAGTYTGYMDRVNALSAADLRRAAARHLHPADLLVVVVGNAEAFGKAETK